MVYGIIKIKNNGGERELRKKEGYLVLAGWLPIAKKCQQSSSLCSFVKAAPKSFSRELLGVFGYLDNF
jgi:hypothetical protein